MIQIVLNLVILGVKIFSNINCRELSRNSDCYSLAQKIKRRHDKVLGNIAAVQIEKVLRLVQITMLGKSLDEAKKDVEKEFSINFEEDMNRLSDKDLKRRKELMDLQFEKNRVQVGDPNFIYDKQVTSNCIYSLFVIHNRVKQLSLRVIKCFKIIFQVDFTSEKVECGWDEEEDDDDFW